MSKKETNRRWLNARPAQLKDGDIWVNLGQWNGMPASEFMDAAIRAERAKRAKR